MRILILFLGVTASLFSQDGGIKISGKVLDMSNAPISFVGIRVMNSQDKMVTATKSDLKGNYFLSLSEGNYNIEYSFVGYKSIRNTLKIQNKDILLQDVRLVENNAKLTEVIIAGTKSTKASSIDKKEYSPTQLLSSQNASAAELINAIPSVNMGNESNNVSFRGDENIAVMINGKLSSLTGQNLSQIPATSIERIEVISVPNSKYNSEGSAGIINVVLKQANAGYKGGYVLGSVGNNNKYNAQLGYNWSMGKWAISGAYNFTYNEFLNNGWSKREYLLNPELHSYRHISNGEKYKRLHSFRIGVDYELSKRNSISFMGNISRDWGSSYSNDADTFRTNTGTTYSRWTLDNFEKDINTVYDLNLAFVHWMPNMKDKWSLEVSRSDNMNDKSADYHRIYDVDLGVSTNYTNFYQVDNIQRRPITAIQSDYLLNINPNHQMETGLRLANRDFRFTNQYNEFGIEVPRWTNDFNYRENVMSLYGLWSGNWNDKLTTKFGLRMEQTNTESFNYDSSLYQFNYFYAFPSAVIRYKLGTKDYLNTSYSMRINRPGPGMLNPLQDVSDPISKRLGDPTLEPEIIQSLELAYGNDVSKNFSFSTSTYYKISNNAITRFLTTNPDGTIFVSVDNIGKQSFIGWELISNAKLSKLVSLNLSSNLSYNQLSYTNLGRTYENGYLNWQGRGIVNIKLPWDMEGQIIGFYKSPFNSPQGTIDFMSNVDLSLRKKFFGQKGMMILSVFDIFNHTKFALQNSDTDFTNEFERKRETRYATISFRYNFGKENTIKKPKIEKPEPREGGGEMGM